MSPSTRPVRLLVLLLTAAALTACGGGPPGPPVDVAPCAGADTAPPEPLELGEPGEEEGVWGPRLARRAPRGGVRVQRVDFGDERQMAELRRQQREGEAAREIVARVRIDATGAVVAREIVRNPSTDEAGEAFLERILETEFHPAQRNGCAIPSVVDVQLDDLG